LAPYLLAVAKERDEQASTLQRMIDEQNYGCDQKDTCRRYER
jgi:hypothetical protein